MARIDTDDTPATAPANPLYETEAAFTDDGEISFTIFGGIFLGYLDDGMIDTDERAARNRLLLGYARSGAETEAER